jgi:hypothetical protein
MKSNKKFYTIDREENEKTFLCAESIEANNEVD